MKTKLALALTVVGISVGLATTGMAASNQDEGDVTVNVSEKVKIDVAPDSLAYGSSGTGIEPGTYQATSDGGYQGVEIENTGSVNLSTVWFETSEPKSRPFGTGTADAYDAGNMIQLRATGEAGSASAAGGYLYAGRREYNESNELSYVLTDAGTGTNGEVRYGRFRTGDKQFFWAINESASTGGGGNMCSGDNSDASNFMLGSQSHSKNVLGSVDFQSGNAGNFATYEITDPTSSEMGKVENVDVNLGTNLSYNVYTWCGDSNTPAEDNSTYVSFRKYDRQFPRDVTSDLDVTGALVNIFDGAASGDSGLQPGEHFTVETRVSVPFAVAEGTVGSGNLTVVASE